MLFGSYFHEKTGSAASYCSLKVTKPPESFKIEAKYAKVCFLWQGLIPSLLRGSQVSQPLDHQSSDKIEERWKKNQFKSKILFTPFPYISQPLIVIGCWNQKHLVYRGNGWLFGASLKSSWPQSVQTVCSRIHFNFSIQDII